MRKLKIYQKIFFAFLIIFLVRLLFPYFEVWNLSRKYGEIFDRRYEEISFYNEQVYLVPRVARYKEEKAGITTDAGFLKAALNDKRENIAVVYYGTELYIAFIQKNHEWTIERWGNIFTGPVDSTVWPIYLQ